MKKHKTFPKVKNHGGRNTQSAYPNPNAEIYEKGSKKPWSKTVQCPRKGRKPLIAGPGCHAPKPKAEAKRGGSACQKRKKETYCNRGLSLENARLGRSEGETPGKARNTARGKPVGIKKDKARKVPEK